MDGKTAAKSELAAGAPTVFVDSFTDGILDPARPMLGPVADGGHIVANTAPGCWGPMITPRLRGGHEVTEPVAVAGAEVGDAIVVRIRDITVTSLAAASGTDEPIAGRYLGDPFVAKRCDGCGTPWPDSRLEGVGQDAVRCAVCGRPASPFRIPHGYTMALDATAGLGLTLPAAEARRVAEAAERFAALPRRSVQHPILSFMPHDLVGVVARLRPFLGQLGTVPAVALPDSHNAGDFGAALIGAPHAYARTPEELEGRTDGHMDIARVRAGAVVVCPVKVPGGGIYVGDMHALQGDGEIAGHTVDVSGTVTLKVEVRKGLALDGPVLLPVPEDLPFLARPLSRAERQAASRLAAAWGAPPLETSWPVAVVGTGPDLNAATDNGLRRAAALFGMSVAEVRNRATITGSIEIGRHPGVVTVTFRVPAERLEAAGLLDLALEQYGHLAE